ncbi:TetR/AcrR family transcriptional regulator [Solwaraspora sp. WMMD791]|uniref:TetR/AcrR family transcriptional regulator n=1 Tax=Solwaraspora sp. WMMD791 TaxID=3016086 RepID=UPI00249BD50D|nr:TetR/AcrR family transcriptional regulator [Solwaraspora sp. WMMD791]WFE27369.1 TetR/AcrR family transcriptional regulator [Solwaraspora sp. WMMD791]
MGSTGRVPDVVAHPEDSPSIEGHGYLAVRTKHRYRLAPDERVRYDRVMSPRRDPVSRRDRPAKAPLSRAGVVAVAARIMREEGLEQVTMRRLAAELDTGPASLYVYISNTAELHGALLDELVAELELPDPLTGVDWREQVISLLCSCTELLFSYPSLARSVLVLRPSGPHYLRLIDTIVGLLLDGDVPTRHAAWGVDILLQQAIAMAAEQGSRGDSAEARGEEHDLAIAIAEARSDTYPSITRVRDEILSGDYEHRMRWVFATIIDGLHVRR